jgi:lipopolysaccharide export system permease protein
VVIYVEDISPSRVGLRGLVVSDERDPKITRVITAREGRLLTDETTRRITLRMLNGAVNEADVVPAAPPKSVITEGNPTGGAAGARRYRYTAFSLYDMNLTVESPLKSAARMDKPEKDYPLPVLRQKIVEAQDAFNRLPLEVELQKRFALPVAALVFALLGFPLAVRSHRGGRSVALVGTLAILVSYYIVMTSLEGVALRERMPVPLAIWLPNLLFGLVGVVLMAVTVREWRAPRMTPLWHALDFLWQSLPRRRAPRDERFTLPGSRGTLIIDRYLLQQYVVFLLVVLAVAATLIIVVDLVQTLDKFLRLKPPVLYILQHFVFMLPAELYKGLPVVMLVGTIFLFLTLTRWHELTALKAAGISLYRASAPILGLGLAVAIGAGLFQEFLLPTINERGEEVDRVKIRGQLPRHLQSQTRLWLRSSDSRFYRVELLSPGTNELFGVTILELDDQFRLVNRLDARRAQWTAAGWEFQDGAFREIGQNGTVTTVRFAQTALELDEGINDFTEIQKPPAAMSYRELREYVARLEGAGFQVRKYLVDLYSKLSDPLKNLIMVLVAIPFALQSPRSGRVYGIALAIAIMAVYMVVDYSARAFAQAELLPPLLAAWTANVIFLGVGTSLFLRART